MSESEELGFELHRRLAWDSEHVLRFELCELRLMNEKRWPWLLLVPQRADIEEIHDLEQMDQAMLAFETNLAAATLKTMTGCLKINTGALGNVVDQLHIHIIARNEDDPNWPGPVWGHGQRVPYKPEEIAHLIGALRLAFDEATSLDKDDE